MIIIYIFECILTSVLAWLLWTIIKSIGISLFLERRDQLANITLLCLIFVFISSIAKIILTWSVFRLVKNNYGEMIHSIHALGNE